MIVPDNMIVAISYEPKWQTKEYLDSIFESLKGNSRRDWFVNHAYHCLPLVIGNQHGFVLKSLYDFEVVWNGGDARDDVVVNMITPKKEYEATYNLQSINPHFGMGTITIQTPYQLRTPPNINLMTINPPNKFIDGLYHMTGVVETDNLRRDFTYNLRITRPNYTVRVNKGDYIGCVIPYPRHFIDMYEITDPTGVISQQDIRAERESTIKLGIERSTVDIKKRDGNGKRYWRGIDVHDNKFPDHQNHLDKK
jgi:hypothetical protein